MKQKKLIKIFLLISLTIICGISAFNIWVDPYWLWRKSPVWLGYKNICLYEQMRFSKPLQLMTRNPEIVFLGSSRVYRGINPDCIKGRTYNFGIAGLNIHEAEILIEKICQSKSVKKIILGLDFFMFDENKSGKQSTNSGLTSCLSATNSVFTAFMSKMSLLKSFCLLQNKELELEPWTYEGFKVTYPKSFSHNYEYYIKFIKANKKMLYSGRGLLVVKNIIDKCKDHDIELAIYISPYHLKNIEAIIAGGKINDFYRWRLSVKEIAVKNNIVFIDFSTFHPFLEDHFDCSESQYWLDISHYHPKLGEWIVSHFFKKTVNESNDSALFQQ